MHNHWPQYHGCCCQAAAYQSNNRAAVGAGYIVWLLSAQPFKVGLTAVGLQGKLPRNTMLSSMPTDDGRQPPVASSPDTELDMAAGGVRGLLCVAKAAVPSQADLVSISMAARDTLS